MSLGASFLWRLARRPRTTQELVAATGLSIAAVRRVLRQARKDGEIVWRPRWLDGLAYTREYDLAPGRTDGGRPWR